MSEPVFRYRLEAFLEQKNRAREEAARALAAAADALHAEQEKLEQLRNKERELTKTRDELRRRMLEPEPGQILTGEDVRARTEWRRALEQDMDAQRGRIFSQRIVVDEAEERVGQAREHLIDCSRQVETLKKHRERSEQKFRREVEQKQALEQEEIASAMHEARRRKHESTG